jgi:aminoglycoside phosphotransferase (APT) family kinase protein
VSDETATQDPGTRGVSPEHLSDLLGTRHPGVSVRAVRVLDETEGSASRLRLSLELEGDGAAGLPAVMFLKRHLADFAFPREMYEAEVRFYRDLLPELPIEAPAVYGVEFDEADARFAILMEDIGTRTGAHLGIATRPETPDAVASVLGTLAQVHAPYWDSPRLRGDLGWLEEPRAAATVRFWQQIGPKLTRRHLRSGHRADLFAGQGWDVDRMWEAFARLQDANSSGPRTVLHGDVHAGNVYYVDGAPGGLLDWQLMLQGCWALDVCYLIVTALTPDDRRDHEAPLLRGYLDALVGLGVDPPGFDDAWLRYRQNILWGIMMWLITPDGVHSDEVQDLSLVRCLEAGKDLDTMGALGH